MMLLPWIVAVMHVLAFACQRPTLSGGFLYSVQHLILTMNWPTLSGGLVLDQHPLNLPTLSGGLVLLLTAKLELLVLFCFADAVAWNAVARALAGAYPIADRPSCPLVQQLAALGS